MSEEGRRVLPSSKLLCDALPITHIFRKQQLAPSLVQVPTATFRGKPDSSGSQRAAERQRLLSSRDRPSFAAVATAGMCQQRSLQSAP
jgi:hypothetical protein